MKSVRWVAFDAVGTLIHPAPSVADVYTEIGQKYGSPVTRDVVSGRFRETFGERQTQLTTNAVAEREFWREIVSYVLRPVDDFERCFEELYEHFALHENWSVSPGAAEVIRELQQRGVGVCIASNFDERLRRLASSMPELATVDVLHVSSEVGWRKPAPEFFELLQMQLQVPFEQILMVGDDYQLDVLASRKVGMQALLYAPNSQGEGIRVLNDVLSYCSCSSESH